MRQALSTLFAAALLLSFVFAAGAADSKSRTFLDRAKTLSVAAQVSQEKYPDADSVLVDDWERAEYNADGTGLHWDESYTKILTEKGKREARTLALDYTLPFGKACALFGEVVKPDGRAVSIDIAANSKEMVDRSQMGENIYNPNDKQLCVTIPELEIGDVVHWVTLNETLKPRMEKSWGDIFVLEGACPVISYTVEVLAPDSLPLVSKALKSPVGKTVSASTEKLDGKTLLRWTAKDVPQYFPEPEMPPAYTCTQRVLVSTIPDWQAVSKWYWSISKPHLDAVTPEMKKLALELTQGKATELEKATALFKHVSQNIRYMGITTEEVSPGYEPHDVSMTFNNKYGVCRDKAALLVALLRLAGLEAYPVIINVGPKKDVEVPLPYFNHAIACIKDSKGGYVLMDPTDESSAELMPAYLCDRSYLVARPEGETLRTSPIVPASENMMKISTKGELDATGAVNARAVLEFEGINDNAYRGHLLRIRPEERKKFFEAKLKAAVSSASLKSLKIEPEDLQDTSKPLRAELEFQVKDALASGKSEALLELPWLGGSFGTVNFILGSTGLEKRRFPFLTGIACGGEEKIELKTGSALGKALSTPSCGKIDSETLAWQESVQEKNGALEASSLFALKAVEFSPAQYLALREALKTVEADRRKAPVFAVEQQKPDTEVLEELVECDVKDASSWTVTRKVKRKILSYAGTKRASEIKIDYNPVWDSVSIKATVTAPDGTQKTLGPKEINTMDAAWAASAPRYPAGKTLVASLPGVGPGAIIDSETRVECKGRPFFSATESFQYAEPLKSKTFALTLPESLARKVRFNLKADEASPDGRRLVWKAADVAPYGIEGSLPPAWTFAKTLFATSAEDEHWKNYAKSLFETLNAAAAPSDAVSAKAAELCAGAKDDVEKATRIRDFTAKSIRLAGPGFEELPVACVTPAAKTLAEGYGNSLDRAVLLYALAQAAGFKPQFVLASGLPWIADKSLELPYYFSQLHFFKAPLVFVEAGKQETVLNDSDQYDKLGATSHADCLTLNLNDGKVKPLHPAAELRTRSEVFWSATVNADGSATLEKTTRLYGMSYGRIKQSYAEMTPEERRRHHQELVAAVAQSAKADGELKANFDGYPGVVSFKVFVPDFAVRDGERLYFDLPEGGFSGLFGLSAEKRVLPFYIGSASSRAVAFSFALPAKLKTLQAGPASFAWKLGGSRATASSSFEPGALNASCDIRLEPEIVPASEYGMLKELNRFLGAPSTEKALLSERE